jgi:hypothetical protein
MTPQLSTSLTAAAFVFGLSFVISMLVAGMVKLLYVVTKFINSREKPKP